MEPISQVYELPSGSGIECTVAGRVALPGAVMELHHYRFRGAQRGVFTSPRGFLDLALSPRPGTPRGRYADGAGTATQSLGSMIFIPAGTSLHTLWGEGEQTSICCGFEGTGLLPDEVQSSEAMLEASLDIRSQPVGQALRRIADEIAHPGFCSELLVQAVWTQAAIELHRYFRFTSERKGPVTLRLSQAQIARIAERIEQPGKPPMVAELAAECGLSTRHFFRQFKAATGQTLVAYASDRKIARARRLLRPGGPAIKQIAWECGFDSAAAFSAAFRKATGRTPRQFRQEMVH